MKATVKRIQTIKTTVARLVLGVALGALMAPSVANAQSLTPFFTEDFEDGNGSDGTPVTWVVGDGGTGKVSNGSYILTTAADAAAAALEYPSVGDVSIRAQMRALRRDPVSVSEFAGTVVYASGDAARAWGDVYWAFIADGYISIGDGNGATLAEKQIALNPFAYDVSLQFDVVGNKLSLTAWRTGNTKPSRPQLTATSSRDYPPGNVGFATSLGMREIAIRSFDAYRIGNSVLPTLNYKVIDGNRLEFTVPEGYTLLSSSAQFPLEWTELSGPGSFELPMSDPARFFQLKGQ